eukprot:COSAG01_NODE_11566_length_1902_cov_1.788131_3_plen_93_part_00
MSILAVRALGETDLNPVSGVGKLSQLLFAVVAPGSVISNLVAGAIAEGCGGGRCVLFGGGWTEIYLCSVYCCPEINIETQRPRAAPPWRRAT